MAKIGRQGEGGGNFSKAGKVQRDDMGNILFCPHCKSTHLIKAGTDGSYGAPERYKCKSCGKKTVHPIVGKEEFIVENPFSEEEMSTEELLDQRIRAFNYREKLDKSQQFLNIKVKDPKPIGIYFQGDPHVDDDGCDLPLLIKHMDIVNKTEGLFSASVGDLSNNWARRTKLEGLWSKQSSTAQQGWQLVEWLVGYTDYIFIVAGNHDMWSGHGDPVKWMMKPLKTTYSPHSIRVNLKLPKHEVRINCAHEFRGNSIYNTSHGIVRHAIFNARDHILVAGHKHISGYMPMKDAHNGIVMHCLQVGSYKKYDDYAKELNLPNKMMSPCGVAVINTNLDETHGDFIKVFWEVDEGADYLTHLRRKTK